LQSLGHWYDILVLAIPAGVSIYVVGTKIDLEDDVIIEDIQAKQFAEVHNAQFFKVSTATGDRLDQLFEQIAEHMLKGVVLQHRGSIYL
jgi:GTPase Era involved in 16S rRNA processing